MPCTKPHYVLALVFVAVWTNAEYIFAAEFLVHSETNEEIEEAFNFLKQWNPLWSPTYFICDYSEAEIFAIKTAFLKPSYISTGNKAGRD